MKNYIILITILTSSLSFAKEKTKYQLELTSSLYTMHYSDKIAYGYENKVSDDGRLIDNPIHGITINWAEEDRSYQSFSLFKGKDSIDSDMAGFAYSIGKKRAYGTGFEIGFITGMYFYDEDKWTERYIEKSSDGEFTTKSPSWVRTYIDNDIRGINIILGIEVNYQINITKDFFFKSKNVITPQIFNTGIAMGINF